MKFDKNIFLSNLDYLMSVKKVKAKDLEEAAGVSKGYISRFRKDGNNSVPGIDFLLAASEMFKVSLEALISVNYAVTSENEVYFINFIDKLISRTEKSSLKWDQYTIGELIDSNDKPMRSKTIVKNGFAPFNALFESLNGREVFNSAFDYGDYNCTNEDDCFLLASLDKNNDICLVKVSMTDSNEATKSGIEMYLLDHHDHRNSSRVCCTLPDADLAFSPFLRRLYNTALEATNNNILDEEVKSAIDTFMLS